MPGRFADHAPFRHVRFPPGRRDSAVDNPTAGAMDGGVGVGGTRGIDGALVVVLNRSPTAGGGGGVSGSIRR